MIWWRCSPLKYSVIAFFSALITATPSCFADNTQRLLKEEIANYNASDWNSTVSCAEQVLLVQPNNFQANYYLAGALVKLNRPAEALASYKKCASLTNDPRMKSYCHEAITTLESGSPLNTQLRSNVSSKAQTSPQDTRMLEQKASVLQEGQKEIEFLKKERDREIAKIHADAAEEMRDVPAFLTPRTVLLADHVEVFQIPNPDYQPTLDRVNQQAEYKIHRANEIFEHKQAEITANYTHRAELYDQVNPDMKSQLRAGPTSIQVVPQGASPYVRNIVNYSNTPSDPAKIPLRAKAGRLDINEPSNANRSVGQ